MTEVLPATDAVIFIDPFNTVQRPSYQNLQEIDPLSRMFTIASKIDEFLKTRKDPHPESPEALATYIKDLREFKTRVQKIFPNAKIIMNEEHLPLEAVQRRMNYYHRHGRTSDVPYDGCYSVHYEKVSLVTDFVSNIENNLYAEPVSFIQDADTILKPKDARQFLGINDKTLYYYLTGGHLTAIGELADSELNFHMIKFDQLKIFSDQMGHFLKQIWNFKEEHKITGGDHDYYKKLCAFPDEPADQISTLSCQLLIK